jgi:hypothetical protein
MEKFANCSHFDHSTATVIRILIDTNFNLIFKKIKKIVKNKNLSIDYTQWWAHIRLFVTSLPLPLHR